jgi:hypothetical protein
VPGNVLAVDSVPNRQDDLFAVNLTLSETIELCLRPMLAEERRREDHYPELRVGEPLVKHAAQSVAKSELKLVEPHA